MSENPVEQTDAQETPVVEDQKVEETTIAPVEEAPKEEAPKASAKPKPRSGRAKANRTDQDGDGDTDKLDQVAVFSDHPVFWPNVGSIGKGYTLLSREAANKWIEKGLAREASADEVAKAYGV